MLKFDKDVLAALQALEKEGHETYAVGECIIEWGIGGEPVDWNLVTKANAEELVRIFPEGELIDPTNGILRLDFTYEETDEDGKTSVLGSVCDISSLEGSIEEEIADYGFTAAAVADNPARQLVDPYQGMDDIKKKLIRSIKDPDELFEQEPIRMMQAMRYVSEYGMDLTKDVHEAIIRHWRKLLDHPMAPIRSDLEEILTGPNAGKALNMMFDTGLMAAIFGEEVAKKISTQEAHQFMTLTENIDKIKPFRLRRLGLLYTVLNEKRGIAAIRRMNFDAETEQHLIDAMTEMIKIQFMSNSTEFKKYIYEVGLDRYNYIHNLSKAQRIVYDQPAIKIEARNAMMREIKSNNEPVFLEDLVIDVNDIMEAGITDSPERAAELLGLVIAKVHQDARNNDRKYLLKMARKYSKSKLSSKTRYIKWKR